MGRKKRFNDDEILEQSLLLFWQYGYTATTYTMLEEATGLTGRSLINAFGDKEQLYLHVLDRYLEHVRTWARSYFEKPCINAISSFFQFILQSPASSPRNRGCLIVNTVFAVDQSTPLIQEKIREFRRYFYQEFKACLIADKISNPEDKADFLLNTLWGFSCQIRFSQSVQSIKSPLNALNETLELWKSI